MGQNEEFYDFRRDGIKDEIQELLGQIEQRASEVVNQTKDLMIIKKELEKEIKENKLLTVQRGPKRGDELEAGLMRDVKQIQEEIQRSVYKPLLFITEMMEQGSLVALQTNERIGQELQRLEDYLLEIASSLNEA